jgi:FMN phosphatase YigB (HAD superfamily)
MAVVTFDFDDTLTQTQWDTEEECFRFMGPNESVCQTLREHLKRGDQVHIVTTRTGPTMDDEGNIRQSGQPSVRAFLQEHLADVQNEISGVHFTSGNLKWMLLHELRSEKHFDDDPCELEVLPPGIQGVRITTLHALE